MRHKFSIRRAHKCFIRRVTAVSFVVLQRHLIRHPTKDVQRRTIKKENKIKFVVRQKCSIRRATKMALSRVRLATNQGIQFVVMQNV